MFLCAYVASLYVGVFILFIGGRLAPPMCVLQFLGPIGCMCGRHRVPCSCVGRGRGIRTSAPGCCVCVDVLPLDCPPVPMLGYVSHRMPGGVPLPLVSLRQELTRILGGSFIRWSEDVLL